MSTKVIDLERWNMQYRDYMNYQGNRWLYMKETFGPAELLDYIDDGVEIDETFPTHEVIAKGRDLFKRFIHQ